MSSERPDWGSSSGLPARRNIVLRDMLDKKVLEAFFDNVGQFVRTRSAPGLLVHSARGRQHVGNGYKALLREAKAQRSHSRRGECYNNAQAESL